MRHPIYILCYIISITYIMPRALLSTYKRLSPFFQLNQLGNIFQIALYEFIPIQNILFGDERELLLL